MKITSIENNKKNKGRLSVYIDEIYSFSISEKDYFHMNLYEKSEISDEEMLYIKETLNFNAAKSDAISYLSYKIRTENEVMSKLKKDGYDLETVEKAINELKAIGYINDKLYVQKYIYDRIKLKPISKKLLKYELRNKGIDESDINEILDDWNIDEAAIAEGLVKKKFGKYDMKDEKIIIKISMFLKHRGYSYDLIESIISKIKTGNVI